MIIAKNKNGVVRTFSEAAWSRFSPSMKQEWTIEPNEVKGSKKQVSPEVSNESGIETLPEAKQEFKSVQMTVADATIKISSIESIEELNNFTEGDERKGILNAVAKRTEDLK